MFDDTIGDNSPCIALTDPRFAFIEAYADFFMLVATGSKNGMYELSPYLSVPVVTHALFGTSPKTNGGLLH